MISFIQVHLRMTWHIFVSCVHQLMLSILSSGHNSDDLFSRSFNAVVLMIILLVYISLQHFVSLLLSATCPWNKISEIRQITTKPVNKLVTCTSRGNRYTSENQTTSVWFFANSRLLDSVYDKILEKFLSPYSVMTFHFDLTSDTSQLNATNNVPLRPTM